MSGLPSPLLDPSRWRWDVAEACRAAGGKSGPVVLCLAGAPGSGKTTLGREIRKKGLPGYPSRAVALIDDGVMSVPFLGFFLRRFEAKGAVCDNLAPFSRWTAEKLVVVYVAIRPWERLDACDVLLRVRCSDTERAQRQALRGKKSHRSSVEPPEGWVGSARVLDLVTG
jgi:hypothetical protein